MTATASGARRSVAGLLLAVVAATTSCGPADLAVEVPEPRVITADGSAEREPAGAVTVAYPDEPGIWYPTVAWDVAAVDLAHLWGLPLYRYDEHGQLVPALAAASRVGSDGAGFSVEIDLREGIWSDGRPVVAADVVATVEALAAGPFADEFAVVTDATAVDDDTVRLTFDRTYARWPHLFAGGRSVLPAHVLATDGLDAYRGGVPVSGGLFRLAGREPGLRARFEAHEDGPLGAPQLASIEILTVPDVDTALGLLAATEVDVVLGHTTLDPTRRAEPVERVTAAAPIGGTWVGLRWWDGGELGGTDRAETRRTIAASVGLDALAEGLVRDGGARAGSVLPGVPGPWGSGSTQDLLPELDVVVDVPRWHELPSFAARAVSRAVAARSGTVALVSTPVQQLVAQPELRHDGSVLVVRDGPRPSLTVWTADEELGDLVDGDAAVRVDDPAVTAALGSLHDEGMVLPLFQVGVTHVWRQGVRGVTPSSWPGLAFWDVGAWTVAEAAVDERGDPAADG